MSTPVAITVSHATLARLEHDIHVGFYLANALRDAGAPVIGSVWPRVAFGTLILAVDPASGDLTATWVP